MTNKDNILPGRKNDSPRSPFKVPDGYFETLEERIEARIVSETEGISTKGKVIRMIKPILGLAASFALILLLAYYPLRVLLPKYLAEQATEKVDKNASVSEDDMMFSYFTLSDESLYEVLDVDSTAQMSDSINADEMLDYLSTAMNETDIYTELQN